MLLSKKAGGVGINLQAANVVFMLEPWWNPAVEAPKSQLHLKISPGTTFRPRQGTAHGGEGTCDTRTSFCIGATNFPVLHVHATLHVTVTAPSRSWYTKGTIEEKIRVKQDEKRETQAETYGQVEDLPEEDVGALITTEQLEAAGFESVSTGQCPSRQELAPYQEYGVRWMRRQESCGMCAHHGGILADDMGVGKTIQTLSTIMLDGDEVYITCNRALCTDFSLQFAIRSLLHWWCVRSQPFTAGRQMRSGKYHASG